MEESTTHISMKVLRVSKERTPEIYWHIFDAIENKGHPKILTYLGDNNISNKNREQAIIHHIIEDNKPYFASSDGSKSYDEYPFACTREGGTDSSVAPVPAKEQQIQGGQLGALCKTMAKGERFKVELVP